MLPDLPNLDVPSDKIAIIVVDHGSRREESNQLLLEVVDAFRKVSKRPIVEPAHMELAEPSLASAFARCVDQGAQLVVVFPYFLSPGRHWNEDIPRLTAEAAQSWPGVKHLVTAPLGLHQLMFRIMEERISHCLQRATGAAESCEICSDSTGCRLI